MAEAPQFDPSQPFEDVGVSSAAPAFDPSRPFEEVKGATASSRESSAPQWLKSWAGHTALPETYDVGKEFLHALNPVVSQEEGNTQGEEYRRNALKLGYSEQFANDYAERMEKKLGRNKALWAGITGAGAAMMPTVAALSVPVMGNVRKFVADPLEKVGGPPREVTEGAAMIGATAAGMRPGMNTLRKAMGRPLEGEVLPPEGGGPGGGPRGGGPTIEGEWTSPMTPREGTNARLLPHDYEGTGTAGDPHFDAAYEALGRSRSAGAVGVPGGPLADMDPAAIGFMTKAIREHGYTPWELERLQEESSAHHFLGEMSPSLRKKMGGLNALGGEPGNTIEGSFRQRGREEPERVNAIFDRGFGPAINVRERKAALSKEQQEASGGFWKEFERTPIPPTPELAAIEDALHASGAWSAAETSLRIRRVPRHNQFVELPNTGEHVLANPELPSETTRVPTAAFYQAAKGRLDASIATALKNEDADRVRELVGLKHALTDAIDNHPDQTVAGTWRQARETWAGPEQLKTAMDLGQRILTNHIDNDLLVELWGTLSEPERVAAMQGSRKYLKSKLGGRGGTLVTMKDVLTPNNQEKLQTILGAEEADRMIADLFHEKDMHESPNRIIYNSVTGERTAAQAEFKPQERWWQSGSRGDIPTSKTGAVFKVADAALSRMQKRSIEEAQKKQAKINSDIARIMTLQGPERNAALRYLHGVNPEEPSPGAGPRPSPRPAPARAASEAEPPPPSTVPEGPPGYPQPEMTVVEASKVLRDFGYPKPTINSMGGTTRVQTADMLQRNYPKGPPSRTPEFPGEVTPRESVTAPAPVSESVPISAEKPLSLLEWIRKQGGIDPNDPMVGDVRAMFGGKNPGGIIRKGGKKLDQLREGAVGEKYFLDHGDIEGREASTDVNTLLDAMVREVDGQKQYPLGADMRNVRNKDMEARSQEQQRELEFSPEARRLDRELGQYGVTRGMMPAGSRERAIEMLRSGVETDAVDAFERAMSEQRQAEAQGEHAAEVGEGLELSPQSGGMAARGNRAAGEGQSGDGADVRDTGARNRTEKNPLNRTTGGRVDASAINSSPTEAQKEAGNYAKDHVRVHGLDITIENAKGSKRSGIDKGGKPWSVALPAHYGYIKGSVGADKDHVDVYLGPHLKSRHVFVVDQKDSETGKFDEHKCLVGFASAKQARNCYLKAFSDGKGKARLGAMHEADIDGFKTWLAAGDTTKPIGKKTS